MPSARDHGRGRCIRRTLRAALYGCVLAGLSTATGCTSLTAPAHARPALPLAPLDALRYALPAEVREDYVVPIDAPATTSEPATRIDASTGLDDGVASAAGSSRTMRGRLSCAGEHPEFHVVLPARQPAPFLLLLPILAGGDGLMWYIAGFMAERGYAVGWCQRVESAMRPHQSAADVETLFRRTIQHNRILLRWANRQAWIRPDRTALLGVSTGGILGGTMLAIEPSLTAGVLILAGGDLPDLLDRSTESRIADWRERRQACEHLDREGLRARIRRDLHSDPARLAACVPTEKVLMVSAGLDAVVPSRNREILWEALGRPARLDLPLLSHYTAVLSIRTVLDSADAFLHARFAAAAR